MKFAIKPYTTPAKGSLTFKLAEDEMEEVEVELHGEPGRKRTKYKRTNIIIKTVTEALVEDFSFADSDEVALIINGLGGTPMVQ